MPSAVDPPVGEVVGPTVTTGSAARAATAVHANATLITNPAETMLRTLRAIVMLSAISYPLGKLRSYSRGPECPRTGARMRKPAEVHSNEGGRSVNSCEP